MAENRFHLVESAPLAPGGCMVCGGLGPKNAKVLDLMQEFSAQQLRLYLCKPCAREIAQAYGWVKGPRMEELDKAAEQIVEIEDERDQANAAAHKMADELTRIQQQVIVLERDLTEKRDREAGLLQYAQQLSTMANQIVVAANGG